jgi:hypothetical protein
VRSTYILRHILRSVKNSIQGIHFGDFKESSIREPGETKHAHIIKPMNCRQLHRSIIYITPCDISPSSASDSSHWGKLHIAKRDNQQFKIPCKLISKPSFGKPFKVTNSNAGTYFRDSSNLPLLRLLSKMLRACIQSRSNWKSVQKP